VFCGLLPATTPYHGNPNELRKLLGFPSFCPGKITSWFELWFIGGEMSIKAVIFDLGGVLVRTESQESRQRLAANLGYSPEDLYHLVFDNPSAVQATLGQVSWEGHWAAVAQTLQMSQDEVRAVQEAFFADDRLDEDLVAYIRTLRSRFTTALLSNAWDNLRTFLVDTWKIADAFDEILISAEVGLAKPDPRIFRLILQRLQLKAQQAVFVDDFIQNIEAARKIGLHTVHFRTPAQALAELQTLLDEEQAAA
jgi:glucose-1-phosphatase